MVHIKENFLDTCDFCVNMKCTVCTLVHQHWCSLINLGQSAWFQWKFSFPISIEVYKLLTMGACSLFYIKLMLET